jgi:hypothetical protein
MQTPYLIFTHNNRMQCLLANFGLEPKDLSDYKFPQHKKKEKVRFQNCAILKISIKPVELEKPFKDEADLPHHVAEVDVELVHEGELSGSDFTKYNKPLEEGEPKLYYSTKKTATGSVIFNKTKIPYIEFEHIQTAITFYLIRHGQGVHNKLKFYNPKRWITKIYDPPLTNEGKEQAGKAALALINSFEKAKGGAKTYMELTQPTEANMVFFVSDLYRTYQTCFEFYRKLMTQYKINIFLLPCAHEISDEKEDCDTTESNNWYTSWENTSTLKYDKINGAFNVDAYKKKYNGSVRKTGDRRCIDTNMLDQAYLILYPEAEAEWIGQSNEDKAEAEGIGPINEAKVKTRNENEWISKKRRNRSREGGRSKKQRKRTSRKTRRR